MSETMRAFLNLLFVLPSLQFLLFFSFFQPTEKLYPVLSLCSVCCCPILGGVKKKSEEVMGKPGTVKVGSPGRRPCRSPSCVLVFSRCCYPPTFTTAGTVTSALWILLILKLCALISCAFYLLAAVNSSWGRIGALGVWGGTADLTAE